MNNPSVVLIELSFSYWIFWWENQVIWCAQETGEYVFFQSRCSSFSVMPRQLNYVPFVAYKCEPKKKQKEERNILQAIISRPASSKKAVAFRARIETLLTNYLISQRPNSTVASFDSLIYRHRPLRQNGVILVYSLQLRILNVQTSNELQ